MQHSPPEGSTEPVRLIDYTPTPYAVTGLHLDIELHPERTRVVAKTDYAIRPGQHPSTPLILHMDEIEIGGIRVDGIEIAGDAVSLSERELILARPPTEPFAVEIESFVNPTANSKLMGLYRSSGIYCTQCEAEGFRRITPFYDRPDVLTTYSCRIEADADTAPVLLANGNLIEAGLSGAAGRHYALWQDPFPKPSYLFALVAGNLVHLADTFTTQSGRHVELRIYVEPGKQDRCGYAMDALKRSMRWDEEKFGREYDLDIFMIVAVSDFNMGAMENKGLNIFNDKYILADPDTATDQDYANIEAIIAHEYFHNWTGNRITCRDWFQLCLKEGLTVYRDQEFSADQRSGPVRRIENVRMLRAHQFAEDFGPLAHPVRPQEYMEINNFYTATVYEKGAEVIRLLRTVLGDKDFAGGLDLYFERHDGTAATVEDFLACFKDVSGADLGQFFRWYTQSGTPSLAVSGTYDNAARSYELVIEQSCPPTPGQTDKAPMHIPVRFALVGPNGDDLSWQSVEGARVTDDVLHITEPRHRIVFDGVASPPVPSLLRGFSAPIELTTNLSDDDWSFLLSHDRDPFVKWQAAQTLAAQLLKIGIATTRDQQHWEPAPDFPDALARIADDQAFDPAFRALMLTLPGDVDMAREIGTDVDPQAISDARIRLKQVIAAGAVTRFADLYHDLARDGAYAPDAVQAGQRSLRNTALDYLLASGERDGETLARRQFAAASNMTDRMAALASLTRWRDDGGADELEAFYSAHKDDPLVVDKWFVLQATAPHASALDRVTSLCEHSAFSYSNPNRIRSLIGAFASGNPTQFNRSDGAGYRFIGDNVIDIDRNNPQVAARMLTAFRSWKSLERERRAQAQNVLIRVRDNRNLSKDTADIAERMLK